VAGLEVAAGDEEHRSLPVSFAGELLHPASSEEASFAVVVVLGLLLDALGDILGTEEQPANDHDKAEQQQQHDRDDDEQYERRTLAVLLPQRKDLRTPVRTPGMPELSPRNRLRPAPHRMTRARFGCRRSVADV
jgi:hypothetical protein